MANYNSSHTGNQIDTAVGRLHDVNLGKTTASKALTVDGSKNVVNINNLTSTGVLSGSNAKFTSITGSKFLMNGNISGSNLSISSSVLLIDGKNLSTNLGNLTDTEATQLENIDSKTISNNQWGYLGSMSAQPLESPILGTDVELSEIGTATYDDIQDWINNVQSAGQVSGGTITDEGDGDVTVAAGTGFIKTSNSAIAETKTFDWAEQTNLTLTDGQTNYIYVEYNAGSPQVGSETTKSANSRDKFYLGNAFREGTQIHIINAGLNVTETMKRIQSRINSTDGELERASGMILSETGSRNIKVTAGSFYAGFTKHTTTEVDTSGADTFEYYSLINGSWTETDESQIDNTQYNDVSVSNSESLATLSNNNFGVHWVYSDINGHILVAYGQDEYDKESDAEDANSPSINYGHIADMSFLIGKIIIKEGGSEFEDLSSAFQSDFVPSTVTDHGDLAGLSDDDHSQYALLSGRDTDTLSIDQVNAYDSAGLGLYDATSGSGVFIEDGGNVGIDVTTADTKLDINGALTQRPLSSDPPDPDVGNSVQWVSNGTGSGDPGDVMMKINASSSIKTITLIDFSTK